MQDILYTGPDRGHFKAIRLMDNTGVQIRANCRIKEAAVYVYLTDMQYSVISYAIEWWPDDTPPPHEGGQATPYLPRNRPIINRLFLRSKPDIQTRMLYLEDAIINDFLNSKVLADSSVLETYAEASADQVAGAQQWRTLAETGSEYCNAVHITRFNTTADTPLTLVEQGLTFTHRRQGTTGVGTSMVMNNYPFTRIRDCLADMAARLDT